MFVVFSVKTDRLLSLLDDSDYTSHEVTRLCLLHADKFASSETDETLFYFLYKSCNFAIFKPISHKECVKTSNATILCFFVVANSSIHKVSHNYCFSFMSLLVQSLRRAASFMF